MAIKRDNVYIRNFSQNAKHIEQSVSFSLFYLAVPNIFPTFATEFVCVGQMGFATLLVNMRSKVCFAWRNDREYCKFTFNINYLKTKNKMKKKFFSLVTAALLSLGTAWGGTITGTDVLKKESWSENTNDYVGTGISVSNIYSAGGGTAIQSFGTGLKLRAAQTTVTIDNIKYGYLIIKANDYCTLTSFNIKAVANDDSKTTELKGVYIDADEENMSTIIAEGENKITANVTFPSRDTKNSNSNYKEVDIPSLSAQKNIVLVFDATNSGTTQINAVITVGYEKLELTVLTTPTITYDDATGEVTIGTVANATKVTYTTNGNTPTSSSTEYTNPFIVTDGTVVKAIAIGDGENYGNSEVASETVALASGTVEAPVINAVNGTVAITCVTPNSTISYSTDGGSSWNDYSRAFTLSADATVTAKATREGWTESAEASKAVTVIAAGTKTLYMGHGSFTASSDNKKLTGKAGDDAEGFTLTFSGDDSKTYSAGKKFTNAPYNKTAIIGSNGASSVLSIPEGLAATRLVLYSYIKGNEGAVTASCGWKEVAGTSYENNDNNYKLIPMGTYENSEDVLTNPDVRVYALDHVTGSLNFTSAGNQLAFVIGLDVVVPMTVTAAGYASFSSAYEVKIPENVKAYYASAKNDNSVTLTEIEGGYIPANTGVILEASEGTYYADITSTDAELDGENLLVANVKAGTPEEDTYYTLAAGPVFMKSSGGELAAGKAYLVLPAGARELSIVFGEVTGISEVVEAAADANAAVYNLNGVRVSNPSKGLYIVNGKKVVK